MKCDNSNIVIPIWDIQRVVTIWLIWGKNYIKSVTDGLKLLQNIRDSGRMVKMKYINPSKAKLTFNKKREFHNSFMVMEMKGIQT